MLKKFVTLSLFFATLAASVYISVTAAFSGPLTDKYLPIQAINYEFGSVSISGYFTQQASTCVVMLTVVDRNVAEDAMPVSPVRMRMTLQPGQIGGLDSEDGRAINVTCSENAASVLVDVGDRDRLSDLQTATLAGAR